MLTPDKMNDQMERARKSRERSKTLKFFIGLGWALVFATLVVSAMYLGRSSAEWMRGR
jgi:presenilin-like A22 family membrane protease